MNNYSLQSSLNQYQCVNFFLSSSKSNQYGRELLQSASLTTKLLAKLTTLTGTIRSNRRELPKLAKTIKDEMERFSIVIYKSNDCTLTIYETKPSKKVIILCKFEA